jgi:predicted Zn-dependent protease
LLKSFRRLARIKYGLLATFLIVFPSIQLASSSHAAEALPQLGDGQEISVAAEKKLGQRIAREIYRDPDYIDDPLLTGYVQRIWQPLLAAAKARGDINMEQSQLAWEVMMGKDRTINAFALPGGYFGLHLGLVGMVANRDELASVLAHELTHVSQRHIVRQISKQNSQAPWLLGAMILGSIAASKNPQAAGAVISGAQAVGAQSQLNFSRDMEREADRIGFAIAQEAGFDVRGFVGMFDKLQNANRINDNGSFPYLRTHPLTTERLGDMQSRLQLQQFAPVPPRTALAKQVEHALMATRARLISNASVDSLRSEVNNAAQTLRSLRQSPTALAQGAPTAERIKDLAQLYSGAFASMKQRDTEAALRYAQATKELMNAMAFEPSAPVEYAQIAIELIVPEIILNSPSPSAEMLTQAAEAIARARKLPSASSDRATLLMWAQLQLRQPREIALATDALQIRLASHPGDAPSWQALASLQEAQGQTLRSLRSLAESRVALMDFEAALDRLKAAQEWIRRQGANHVEASIIDTRTRAVQAMVRELQNERDKPLSP